MFTSKSNKGFYETGLHPAAPTDLVEITAEQYSDLLAGQSQGKLISWGEDGYPFLSDHPVTLPQVPQRVTMRQARLALHNTGKLTAVEAAINALPEPPRTTARIEWDFSSEVHRGKEFVAIMGTALGLTNTELDELFTQAALL